MFDKTTYAIFTSPENSILLTPSSRDIRTLIISDAKMYQQQSRIAKYTCAFFFFFENKYLNYI